MYKFSENHKWIYVGILMFIAGTAVFWGSFIGVIGGIETSEEFRYAKAKLLEYQIDEDNNKNEIITAYYSYIVDDKEYTTYIDSNSNKSNLYLFPPPSINLKYDVKNPNTTHIISFGMRNIMNFALGISIIGFTICIILFNMEKSEVGSVKIITYKLMGIFLGGLSFIQGLAFFFPILEYPGSITEAINFYANDNKFVFLLILAGFLISIIGIYLIIYSIFSGKKQTSYSSAIMENTREGSQQDLNNPNFSRNYKLQIEYDGQPTVNINKTPETIFNNMIISFGIMTTGIILSNLIFIYLDSYHVLYKTSNPPTSFPTIIALVIIMLINVLTSISIVVGKVGGSNILSDISNIINIIMKLFHFLAIIVCYAALFSLLKAISFDEHMGLLRKGASRKEFMLGIFIIVSSTTMLSLCFYRDHVRRARAHERYKNNRPS